MHSGIENAIYNRTTLLLGSDVMERLSQVKVLVVGVGGVGSWCAEGLVRSGVTHLTIVDSDRVCITNVNRQIMATTKTVGQVKVDVLRQRLLEINPKAEVEALQKIYCDEDYESFHLGDYDYIIDAVDSLKDKASLILRACQTDAVFYSSMGAALKIDPTNVKVAEFWKVQGCPLAAALRRKFKHSKTFPKRKFLCVYDPEVRENRGRSIACGTEHCMCPKAKNGPGDPDLLNHEWCSLKAQINGTTSHVTAMFGMMLSGMVVDDIYKKTLGISKK